MSKKPMSDKEAGWMLFHATALIGVGIVLVVGLGTAIWMCCMMFFH